MISDFSENPTVYNMTNVYHHFNIHYCMNRLNSIVEHSIENKYRMNHNICSFLTYSYDYSSGSRNFGEGGAKKHEI